MESGTTALSQKSEDIYLLRGRVRFLNSQAIRQHTPFSLMLITLGATVQQKVRYAALVPGYWLARADVSVANTA